MSETLEISESLELKSGNIKKYYEIYVSGLPDKFWQITCPCGVTAEYPLTKLPEVDTPHPCGNPDHWTTKYE